MAKTNEYRLSPITVEEYMRIKSNPDRRLTRTPFGMPPGEKKVVVSTAVDWKGVKGAKFWEEAKKHVGKKNVGLSEALAKAIRISKGCAGITGTMVYGGRTLPKKVVCQMARTKEYGWTKEGEFKIPT